MQIGMVTEVHMAVPTKSPEWWLDFGTTIHVYSNREQFKTHEKCEKPEEILMGNNGGAKVLLNSTLEQKLKLLNVFLVLEIRKNLAPAYLLFNNGSKIVLESDEVIIFKNFVFVEKELLIVMVCSNQVLII